MRRALLLVGTMFLLVLSVHPAPAHAAVDSLHGQSCGFFTAPDGTEERVCAAVNRHDILLYVEGHSVLGLIGNCNQVKIVEVKLYQQVSGPDILLRNTVFNDFKPCGQPAEVFTTDWYTQPCNPKTFYGRVTGKVQGENLVWSGLLGKSGNAWTGTPC